jgi:hypothetical protein
VAHHTDCTFIRVSGSELVQKYIGEGSRMVRELFVMARSVSLLASCAQLITGVLRPYLEVYMIKFLPSFIFSCCDRRQ